MKRKNAEIVTIRFDRSSPTTKQTKNSFDFFKSFWCRSSLFLSFSPTGVTINLCPLGKCMEGIQFGVFDASIEHRLDWKRSITEQESAKEFKRISKYPIKFYALQLIPVCVWARDALAIGCFIDFQPKLCHAVSIIIARAFAVATKLCWVFFSRCVKV